jgi:demethylmenaquinone methyltransferase/2-methoxy-6-polyprenyl-1,4-benzoquinol methylase
MKLPANDWNESQEDMLRVLSLKEETRAFYNRLGKAYDLLADRSEQPIRRLALVKLNALPGEKVLEIGFGTGHCVVALAQRVGARGKVYGIDLSDEMLKIGRAKLQREGLAQRALLIRGDAVNLPYPASLLDAIFMSFTLELFDTPEIPKVLSECRRVLRPGGRIVVAGLSKEGENGALTRLYEWTHQHFPNLVDCRPIFIRRALESAGFRIENVEHKMMWLPVEIVLAIK